MQEELERGKEGWDHLQSHCKLQSSLEYLCPIWICFQIGLGILLAEKKKHKGNSRPHDQSGGLLWMLSGPAVHSISLPSMTQNQIWVLKRKPSSTKWISLSADWIPVLHKALYSLRTFRFSFSSHNWNHTTSAETAFMNQKKIFINLPLLKTWLWLLIKISI